MKNIQIIDGADNCTYEIFSATESEFRQIFPRGRDIEFAEDLYKRLGKRKATALTEGIWRRPVGKEATKGIHGTLFYQLAYKKPYYPTKKAREAVALAPVQRPRRTQRKNRREARPRGSGSRKHITGA